MRQSAGVAEHSHQERAFLPARRSLRTVVSARTQTITAGQNNQATGVKQGGHNKCNGYRLGFQSRYLTEVVSKRTMSNISTYPDYLAEQVNAESALTCIHELGNKPFTAHAEKHAVGRLEKPLVWQL